eukprot:Skav228979  [mRNA]  locus=scaffold671:270189:271922:- [translate_table: standard]
MNIVYLKPMNSEEPADFGAVTVTADPSGWVDSCIPSTGMVQTMKPAANTNKDRARYEQQPLGSVGRFYKTRQCAFYAKGKCTRGEQCKYAHGQNELQERPDLTFTSLCREYATTGTCTNPECSFAHNPEQLRATGKFFKANPAAL